MEAVDVVRDLSHRRTTSAPSPPGISASRRRLAHGGNAIQIGLSDAAMIAWVNAENALPPPVGGGRELQFLSRRGDMKRWIRFRFAVVDGAHVQATKPATRRPPRGPKPPKAAAPAPAKGGGKEKPIPKARELFRRQQYQLTRRRRRSDKGPECSPISSLVAGAQLLRRPK